MVPLYPSRQLHQKEQPYVHILNPTYVQYQYPSTKIIAEEKVETNTILYIHSSLTPKVHVVRPGNMYTSRDLHYSQLLYC